MSLLKALGQGLIGSPVREGLGCVGLPRARGNHLHLAPTSRALGPGAEGPWQPSPLQVAEQAMVQ